MKKWLALSVLGLLSAPAFAGPPEGQCEYETEQYEVEVEVCDTRTVYVDVNKTRCDYEGAGHKHSTLNIGHTQCPLNIVKTILVEDDRWDDRRGDGADGRGDDEHERWEEQEVSLRLVLQNHLFYQRAVTEQYNCRTETKTITETFVIGGGP